jgi:uncharacterized protein
MLRITADTNIFISGLNFAGKPFELLTLARAGVVEIAMSEPIMAEIKRVLHDKFKWPDDDVAAIEKEIRGFTSMVEPKHAVDVVKADPTDNRILECAETADSHFIVSGDNHLLQLEQFDKIRILKVADLLDEIARGGLEH